MESLFFPVPPCRLGCAVKIDEVTCIWYHSGSGTNALANVGPQPTFFVVRSRAAAAVRVHRENREVRKYYQSRHKEVRGMKSDFYTGLAQIAAERGIPR